MRIRALIIPLLFVGLLSYPSHSSRSQQASGWTFAVSGDSRNCGDVIMPAIAAGARQNHAEFYWHLGDLRLTTNVDEDYQHEPQHRDRPPDKAEYSADEWQDFIDSQIKPFGSIPFLPGIGNHELYPPKDRAAFIRTFSSWLDSEPLKKQRIADTGADDVKTYFHWIQGGVDFIFLDNASHDQFDTAQMRWFEGVVQRAATSPGVRSVVVGMHAALPDSLASGHSMNDWPVGTESGRQVYKDLLKFRAETKKPVYVLASHSHFYIAGIFDSDAWRANGGVLPGWIVGTAGAHRYLLPPNASRAADARQKTYGYLLGTVHPDGTITFTFQEISENQIPAEVVQRFTPAFVDHCFTDNSD